MLYRSIMLTKVQKDGILMEALYDATILLSVGLTAVLGAIFAIATSFFGRSLQQAREVQEQEEQEAERRAEARVAEMRNALETESPRDAIAMLRQQQKQAEKADKKLRKSSIFLPTKPNPRLLGVLGSVIIPGISFIFAVVFSSVAKSFVDDPDGKDFVLWFFSLMLLVYGMWFLLQTLKEVERVSSTSKDVSYRRQVAAMKQAMAERDEETRPVVEVTCLESFPIRMAGGEEREIAFDVTSMGKTTPHNAEVTIFMPQGFEFTEPEGRIVPNTPDLSYHGWVRTNILDEAFLRPRITYTCTAKMRAPHESGTYQMGYGISSEEYQFNTGDEPESEFTIEVQAE